MGVKAMIRLAALDEDGKSLSCINEQTTYLHIVRFGAPPPADEEDKRPWVVKVVKREATVSKLYSVLGPFSRNIIDRYAYFPPARDLRSVELHGQPYCAAGHHSYYIPADKHSRSTAR